MTSLLSCAISPNSDHLVYCFGTVSNGLLTRRGMALGPRGSVRFPFVARGRDTYSLTTGIWTRPDKVLHRFENRVVDH